MRFASIDRLWTTGRQLVGRFVGKTDGIAAVEFGLLVPLLFVMLIGTVEIGQAVGLDRRVSMATSAVSDLIAQGENPDLEAPGIMDIVQHMLTPYDASRLSISVVLVHANLSNATDIPVLWSYSHNGAPAPSRCARYTMPTGLLVAGDRAYVAEGRYDYEPLLVSYFLNTNMTLQDKSTHLPRKTVSIPLCP